MNKENVKELIERTVTQQQGCKATALVAEIATKVARSGVDIIRCIEELVQEQRIVEVEYVLGNMDYRIKSFYLPKDTTVYVEEGQGFIKQAEPNSQVA